MMSSSLIMLMLVLATSCHKHHQIVDDSAKVRQNLELSFLADEKAGFSDRFDMNSTIFEYSGGPRAARSVNGNKLTRHIHTTNSGTSVTSMSSGGKGENGLPPPCYVNTAGYVCCSRELEQFMISKYYEVANTPRFNNCNLIKITNYIQNACQQRFGRNFEIVTGLDDYSQKVHFYGAYVCKIEVNGRFIMGYATPDWTKQ